MVYLGIILSTLQHLCSSGNICFLKAEHFLEALFEVFGEESIKKRVGTGVDVGEDDHGKVDVHTVFRDDMNQVDNVGGVKGKPTKYKDQHDDDHHACHLALGFAPLSQACTFTC